MKKFRTKVEVYRVDENDIPATIPIEITDILDLQEVDGLETTKDAFAFKINNDLLGSFTKTSGSWSNAFAKKLKVDNFLNVNDEVRILAAYGTTTFTDSHLLMYGTVRSFDHTLNADRSQLLVKGINRTEELLGTMTPFSARSLSGTIHTAPAIVKQIVNRLNQANPKKKIYGYLTSETNPITNLPGSIQAVRSDSTAFPNIDYNSTWKPVYLQIEAISDPQYTKDSPGGRYVFYVVNKPVTASLVGTVDSDGNLLGTSINEIVWKSKGLVALGSFIEGQDFSQFTISLDTRGVVNALIVDAGTDLKGNGIRGVSFNAESIGKNGAKWEYYSNSRRIFSDLLNKETNLALSLGSTFDDSGYVVEYPYKFQFPARSASGESTGVGATASTKSGWNSALRTESRFRAVDEANKILEYLGDPKYEANITLEIGSNNYAIGEIYHFKIPSIGWDGTLANPTKQLRITDQRHMIGRNGWQTSLTAKEDEKVIQLQLGT